MDNGLHKVFKAVVKYISQYLPILGESGSDLQNGGIIMSAQFEEGGLIYESYDYAESGDKYDDNSIMPPLISKEQMDAMDSGDESEYETISTEMFEDICDGSKSRLQTHRLNPLHQFTLL